MALFHISKQEYHHAAMGYGSIYLCNSMYRESTFTQMLNYQLIACTAIWDQETCLWQFTVFTTIRSLPMNKSVYENSHWHLPLAAKSETCSELSIDFLMLTISNTAKSNSHLMTIQYIWELSHVFSSLFRRLCKYLCNFHVILLLYLYSNVNATTRNKFFKCTYISVCFIRDYPIFNNNYFSNTYVLPSVNGTAGPTNEHIWKALPLALMGCERRKRSDLNPFISILLNAFWIRQVNPSYHIYIVCFHW